MKRTLKTLGIIVLALCGALVVFGAVSHALYYGPQAAELPCRNCDGAARAVNVDGFDLYYREMGTDTPQPPVVLLHGGPGQSSQTFRDDFDFLAETRRVIFYDQRGSGNSQIKPGAEFYTIDLLVEELETLRREVIRADTMTLIAHSAGGALALRYALAYPSFAVNRDITRSAMGGNFDAQLAHLAFPALVIYGQADASPYTGAAVAQQLASTLPNATLAAMERSGHWPYLEEPESFQAAINGFLEP